ncbi:hypothetical protein C1H46_012783 [Malus baccata]|uniref:Pentacotripeptide-repeat region of PRORP domain-containing protein n=1 Tax=Malus baccata TaxID=106549 RepID=A0A540MTK8_MALBA|nr:hypothetical protein C1H46_012783 [Malus baccata]
MSFSLSLSLSQNAAFTVSATPAASPPLSLQHLFIAVVFPNTPNPRPGSLPEPQPFPPFPTRHNHRNKLPLSLSTTFLSLNPSRPPPHRPKMQINPNWLSLSPPSSSSTPPPTPSPRNDFKATHDVIVSSGGVAGVKTFASAIDRLVRAGRPAQAVSFFEKMEKDYGLKRDKDSLKLVIEKLCENGFASNAEKMMKGLANEFFPDEYMCDLLIKGWCVDGKLEETRRLAGEMYRGGFEIGTTAYNAILDCVSKLCRKKDTFRLHLEVEEILVDMDAHGVPRNVETFNVLISNLCKIRRTEDALNLFDTEGVSSGPVFLEEEEGAKGCEGGCEEGEEAGNVP